jgi:hypothetical protein
MRYPFRFVPGKPPPQDQEVVVGIAARARAAFAGSGVVAPLPPAGARQVGWQDFVANDLTPDVANSGTQADLSVGVWSNSRVAYGGVVGDVAPGDLIEWFISWVGEDSFGFLAADMPPPSIVDNPANGIVGILFARHPEDFFSTATGEATILARVNGVFSSTVMKFVITYDSGPFGYSNVAWFTE